MSVGSLDPIVDDRISSLNRTRSFEDMIIENIDKKRRRQETFFKKWATVVTFVILIVLDVYMFSKLTHLQSKTIVSDAMLKDIERKIHDNGNLKEEITRKFEKVDNFASATKSATRDTTLNLEKLKILVNMESKLSGKKSNAINEIKAQVKISTLQISNLEQDFEKIALKLLRLTNNKHNEAINSYNRSSIAMSEKMDSQTKVNKNQMELMIAMNLTLDRMNNIETELEEVRKTGLLNSKLMHNLPKSLNSNNERPLPKDQINLDTNSTEYLQSFTADIKDSIYKLRFGRRRKYFITRMDGCTNL